VRVESCAGRRPRIASSQKCCTKVNEGRRNVAVTIDDKVRAERKGRAEHAAHLADRYGFKMIPVHSVGPDGKTCSCPAGASCPPERRGKHPRGEGWQNKTDGLDEIQQTAQRGANFNIGVLVEP